MPSPEPSTNASPTPSSVITDLDVVTAALQTKVDAMVCSKNISLGGGGKGTVRIYVTDTACGTAILSDVRLPGPRFVEGQPRTGAGTAALQEYSIPFAMVATGNIGAYSRNVVLQGEYRFSVGRSSFAKYALFTNVHRSGAGGSDIWFTDRTLFDGPVHTNQYFRFYRKPWFGDGVTSAGCTDPKQTKCKDDTFGYVGAQFYNEGFQSAGSMAPSSQNPKYTNGAGTHQPELTGGVDWNADFVPLPENAQNQVNAAQGNTTDPTVKGQGLFFGDRLHSLTMWAGDEDGNSMTYRNGEWKYKSGSNWVSPAPFQYIEACTTSSASTCTRYRYGPDKKLYEYDSSNATWPLVSASFNGVIYGDGAATKDYPYGIDRVRGPERESGHTDDPDYAPPALASFSEITIAATSNIRVTGDLKYEDRPCSSAPERNDDGTVTGAECDNLDAVNVLGLYTQSGDIRIGHNNGSGSSRNAPKDVTIDGVLMSGEGMVTVEDYDHGSENGSVRLTGGIIEYYYGAFGTFNPNTGKNSTGYGRKFTYDPRMKSGVAPPYFPTVGTDGVKSVKIFSFGQREQLQ